MALSTGAISQNIKFEGTVKDGSGIALEMANVMAINNTTKAMDAYGITNGEGKFSLNLKASEEYTIKVSYIGFKSYEKILTTEKTSMKHDIVLAEGTVLNEIEVVHVMPVSVKGDTIIYDADSFKTGTEQKLEDVLKKLPGVEVNADGEIEVEGKKVTQMMVDGKKFFEGDTKLGSKNIPADAVDKVQVLRNYTENSQMKGLENNNDDVAINIKLKEGKKKFWFGDLAAGVGPDERYIVNPKLFYYSPNTSINVLSNFNNTGDVPFSLRDYFRLTGGSRNTISRSGSNFNVSSNDLGISAMRNDRAASIENKFGAINLTQQMSKTWNTSAFAVVSSSKTLTNTISKNGIFQPNSTEIKTEENRTDISNVNNNLAIVKLGSKFKPNANFQFDYDVSMKKSGQEEENTIASNSITYDSSGNILNNNQIFSFKEQDPISVNQSVNMFYTQNDKSTWVLELQHLYQDEDPLYNPELENDPFPFLGFNASQSSFNISQQRFVKTNKLDAKIDYFYQVNNKNILNITGGNTFSHQGYNSTIAQILDNNSRVELIDSDFRNDVKYDFMDSYLGVHYKMLRGKFTFNPGFSVHNYNLNNEQNATEVKDNFVRILPDVFAQWQIKKSESLTYNYRMSNQFNDVSSIIEGYIFNNFNSFSRGNRYLENAMQQNHSLRYFKYNLFNYTTIFANINYNKTNDPVTNRAFFNGIYQESERVNANYENQSLSGTGSYSRSFKKYYKASVSANLSWSENNSLRVNPADPANPNADFVQTTESFNQTYRASLGTQFREMPNIEAGYSIGINDYAGTTFTTKQPFVKLDYYFLNGFSFTADYDFYNYSNSNGTVENQYEFLNASLNYRKKDAKMEYRINATNLLNTTSLNDDSFSITNFRTSQYLVQPRYIVFSLKYNL